MALTPELAVERAKTDLAQRLGIEETEIKGAGVADHEFPDMSLGAPLAGELSAQMIASGWQILLDADGGRYEYRADKYQLRLYDFEGENYLLDVE